AALGASDEVIQNALAGVGPAIGRALASDPRGDEGMASMLSPVTRTILGKRLAIAYAAAVEGGGPALARGADADAVARLAHAELDVREAPRVFERLRRDAHSGGAAERFFYGNEAALAEHASVLRQLVETQSSERAMPHDAPGATESFVAVVV